MDRIYEGVLATQDELAFPDWRKRLKRAEKESREGKGVELEEFVRRLGRKP